MMTALPKPDHDGSPPAYSGAVTVGQSGPSCRVMWLGIQERQNRQARRVGGLEAWGFRRHNDFGRFRALVGGRCWFSVVEIYAYFLCMPAISYIMDLIKMKYEL